MRTRILLLTAATFVLTACTTPLVTPDVPSFQHKMSNERDWDALANRTASAVVDHFDGQLPVVFVAPGPSDMPFAATFHNLLQQEFLARGIQVDDRGLGATVVTFDVQTFKYRNSRDKSVFDYASFWTIGGAGASQTRKIVSADTAAAIGSGIGPAADILMALFDGTKAEVVVTLTVRRGTNLVYRDMRTVFVQPTELPLYWTQLGEWTPQAKAYNAPDVDLSINGGYR